MKKRILLLLILPLFITEVQLYAQEQEEVTEVEILEEEPEEDPIFRSQVNVPITCYYYSTSGLVDLVFERDLGTSCITVRNLTDGGEDTYIHVGVGIKSFFLENEGLYYIRIVTSSGRVFGALFYANIGAPFE